MGNPKTTKTFGTAGCYMAVFAAAFWLLFSHLDNHLLWGDEAETALLAKNVMQFGVPRTFDGTNHFSLHGTKDETSNHVWIWSPWLQEYVVAGSFIVFGPTTWAARAPFAFAGWCSLVALALVSFKIYRSHWVVLASVLLLGSSEVFLLHARQCRYYSISVLAEILFVYGMHQLVVQNKRGAWVTALALTVQFYSNYIIAVANLPALLLLAWLFRKQARHFVLRVAAVGAVFFIAIMPWLIYAHPWRQGEALGGENYFKKIWFYLTEFHFHFLPLCFLLLPLLGFGQARIKRPVDTVDATIKWEWLLLLPLPLYFMVILVAPGAFLRYELPLLPVACLLAAAWIFRYVKWRTLAVGLVLAQSASNVLQIVTAYPVRGYHHLRSPLVEYVQGMAVPYADRFSDATDFFKREAHPRDMILVFDPEFPLRFYTRLTVVDGVLTSPPKGRLPDWIMPASASGVFAQNAVDLPDFLKPYYETLTIPVHDSIRGDCIPEPDFYQYQSAKNFAPFVIYKLTAHEAIRTEIQ